MSLVPLLLAALLLAVPAAAPAGPALRDLPADLAADVGALAAPATAWWLMGGAALTAGVAQVEDAERTSRALDRGAWDFMADRGNLWGDARLQAPLALAVWGVGAWSGHDETAVTGAALVRGLALTYAVVGAVKPVVDRTRPNGEPYSFPSGHTAAAFNAAGVLTRRHGGWLGAGSLVLAAWTGLGRMEDRKHHASDVVAGAAIGWLCGRNAARGPGERGPDLAVGPGGVVLTARW